MEAKKIVKVYARVNHNGREFKVYPNGAVYELFWNNDIWEEESMGQYEDDYNEIRAAGLKAIEEQ